MAWPGGSSGIPSEKLQLSFQASGLRNRDAMGTSDPMLAAYGIATNGQEVELGRSETIPNTLNPKWVFHLDIEYRFEEIQPLRFVVFDVDSNYKAKSSDKMKLAKQDYLGEVKTTLSEILASPPHVLTRPLQAGVHSTALLSPLGSLTIRAEKIVTEVNGVPVVPEEVEFRLRCTGLENLEMFSKSDPILRISKWQPDGTFTPVHQTEEIHNNLNPVWKPFQLTLQQLCNGDKHRQLLLECLDYNDNGKHKLIGSVTTTFNQLQETCQVHNSLTLTRKSSNPKHSSKSRGSLFVTACAVSTVFSIVDYILCGCEISFFVAIDFTASNGDPRSPGSLHYIDPMGRPNAYQMAIDAVGGVLQYYDTDKRFPCWGFGGRVNGSVSHCFPLNRNASNPTVDGIPGIHLAYSQSIYSVELYGPTWFAPVVRQASAMAAEFQGQMKYFVLLLLTDGAILDMQETISAIVDASYLPLSLLIVGVGNADFSAMDFLDADNKKLVTAQGRAADRDIVQFVPLQHTSVQDAAKKLLKELPGQVNQYMKKHNIRPVRPVEHAFANLGMAS